MATLISSYFDHHQALDKYRAEALANDLGEAYRGFAHSYWAFAKSPLAHTLSVTAEENEEKAVDVFQLILTYAGLVNKGQSCYANLLSI
jgi:hypothetical protein